MSTTETVRAWATTSAGNALADAAITSADSQNPATVDNNIRSVMVASRKQQDDLGGKLIAGGSANALTVTTGQVLEAGQLTSGLSLRLLATADNTTTGVTFAPDGLSALAIKRADGSALAVGDIKSGMYLDLVYNLAATEWRCVNIGLSVLGTQTVWIPAGAITPRTTNGPSRNLIEMTTSKNMVSTLNFDASTQEFAQFDIRMPKSWNEGTVTFIPVWSHAATTVNFGVVFGLDAVAISNDDAMDVAFGTAQTSTDTGGTTNDSYQGPESAAITIAGTPAVGDLVMFRLHRDPANGSDTLAVDARLHGIVLLYLIDVPTDA